LRNLDARDLASISRGARARARVRLVSPFFSRIVTIARAHGIASTRDSRVARAFRTNGTHLRDCFAINKPRRTTSQRRRAFDVPEAEIATQFRLLDRHETPRYRRTDRKSSAERSQLRGALRSSHGPVTISHWINGIKLLSH